MVELSGNCPPSPKDLAGVFSRLSFDFSLGERLLETRILSAADQINFGTDRRSTFHSQPELVTVCGLIPATSRIP